MRTPKTPCLIFGPWMVVLRRPTRPHRAGTRRWLTHVSAASTIASRHGVPGLRLANSLYIRKVSAGKASIALGSALTHAVQSDADASVSRALCPAATRHDVPTRIDEPRAARRPRPVDGPKPLLSDDQVARVASRASYSAAASMPGRTRRRASALSCPRATTAPTSAERVWRGTPGRSVQLAQYRSSRVIVSPRRTRWRRSPGHPTGPACRVVIAPGASALAPSRGPLLRAVRPPTLPLCRK